MHISIAHYTGGAYYTTAEGCILLSHYAQMYFIHLNHKHFLEILKTLHIGEADSIKNISRYSSRLNKNNIYYILLMI